MLLSPFTFRIQVSHQTQESSSNSSRLDREYVRALHGAPHSFAAERGVWPVLVLMGCEETCSACFAAIPQELHRAG
jgi:hypothetical protein